MQPPPTLHPPPPHPPTVLSSFLFSLYSADCRSQHENTPTVKIADNTGPSVLITDDDDFDYRQQISDFVDWCDENYLHLAVGKTKEVITDFRRNQREHSWIEIKGETVERVNMYKNTQE